MKKIITPNIVVEIASDIANKSAEDIFDSNRLASNVAIRDLCIKICKDDLNMVDRDIAEVFKRDRSSITYALKRVEVNLSKRNQYSIILENIRERIADAQRG